MRGCASQPGKKYYRQEQQPQKAGEDSRKREPVGVLGGAAYIIELYPRV
jgi:hypothetical protein